MSRFWPSLVISSLAVVVFSALAKWGTKSPDDEKPVYPALPQGQPRQ